VSTGSFLIALTPVQGLFLRYMLEAPDVLWNEDLPHDQEAFEKRAFALATEVSQGGVQLASDLDREIIYLAATESTYMADAGSEEPIVKARLSKVAQALEQKLSAALGREVNIPRG